MNFVLFLLLVPTQLFAQYIFRLFRTRKLEELRYPLFVFLISVMCCPASWGQKSREIKQGMLVQNDLSVDDSHVYTIYLDSGQFIYGEVFQKDIDTRSIIYGPDDVQRFRHLGETRGIDPIQFVTDRSGIYRFVIEGAEKKTGSYSLILKRIEPVSRTPESRVDQIMLPFKNNKNPGAAIAVIKNGKVVFAKGYGMASLEYDIPITAKTPFQIASLSKQFTAFAIAMLAEQGKLSLRDDIRKYMPEFPDYGKSITLLDLIHHTAGLRDQWDLWELSGRRLNDILLQEELLRIILQQRELNFEPGTKISYSNSGYTLLAEVIQRVTGLTFRQWMQQNIFIPLKMANTFISDDYRENTANQATSYLYNETGIGKAPLVSNNFGPTGVVSTAEDLVKWMRNFRSGEVGGRKVTTQIQERGILSNGDTTYYAFGVGVSLNRGYIRLGHHGSMAGYASSMTYYPQLDAGIVLLSNNKNVLAGYFATQIIDSYFPELKTIQSEKRLQVQQPSNNLTPEYLQNFVGDYSIKGEPATTYRQFTIKREGDRLFADLKGGRTFALRSINDSLFNVEGFDSEFRISFFKRKDKNGPHGEIILSGSFPFVKTDRKKSSAHTLKRYAGRYYSSELQSIYTVTENNGHLVISNNRTEDVILEERDDKDLFTGIVGGQYWLLHEVRFFSNSGGNICGFRISSSRTRNLLFNKL